MTCKYLSSEHVSSSAICKGFYSMLCTLLLFVLKMYTVPLSITYIFLESNVLIDIVFLFLISSKAHDFRMFVLNFVLTFSSSSMKNLRSRNAFSK